jgi:hypothetical protein
VGEERRCPICGKGVLKHLGTEAGDDEQQPDSPILETYSCGHTVTEGALASADAERLEVERRQSEETVDPGPSGVGENGG